jgi:hypothetical protein
MSKRWIAVLAATLALLLGGAGLSQQSLAQDASTPEAHGHDSMSAPADHPAHIHFGTCAELGDIAFPLNNLTSGGAAATPEGDDVATPDASLATDSEGGEGATSSTDVEASLEDIIAGGHAINVHESVENIQNYIACGDVTGTATGGVLEVELAELNASGYSGTATLTDNGDGTTTVEVTVQHGESGATPEASPAS